MLCSYKSCGPFKRSKVPIYGLYNVHELLRDVHSHFVTLKLKHHYTKTADWNDKTLIENRMGQQFQPDDFICASHRYTLRDN